ncbi:hypothetical protein PQX77_016708 [Marasmius sp. AFHP31]|nr:hypothetical protein PQX77_016708 [Marasmius sp. AFHP31]
MSISPISPIPWPRFFWSAFVAFEPGIPTTHSKGISSDSPTSSNISSIEKPLKRAGFRLFRVLSAVFLTASSARGYDMISANLEPNRNLYEVRQVLSMNRLHEFDFRKANREGLKEAMALSVHFMSKMDERERAWYQEKMKGTMFRVDEILGELGRKLVVDSKEKVQDEGIGETTLLTEELEVVLTSGFEEVLER